jgi:hypothetical protein
MPSVISQLFTLSHNGLDSVQIFREDSQSLITPARILKTAVLSRQNSLTLTTLIHNVYAPNFENWNTYFLLRCNTHISYGCNNFLASVWN